MTTASAFYQKSDFWALPNDPTVPATDASVPMRPYYQLIRLPGQDTEAFQLVIPFVPADRQNMVAWMAASSDPADFGKLTVFRLPEGRNIEGPTQVMSRINQDPTFSAQRTLLGQGGSTVQFGDFLVIPIDDSFLYEVPVYVRAVQEAAVPELKQVIIVNGSQGQVSLGKDLDTALREAVTGLPPTGGGNGGGNPPPTGSVSQQIQRLLGEAQSHFQNAQAALTRGDLATYQSEINAAQQDVDQAAQLSGQSPTPTTSPSASPSASASPSG